MANVTRIKANDGGSSKKDAKDAESSEPTRKVAVVKAKNSENKKLKAKKAEKAKQVEKEAKKADKAEKKKTFFLFVPFVALGRYIKESFQEVRQVRWPDRKSTWKMTFTVIIYVLIIGGIIMLLDALFTWLSNLIIGGTL